MPSVRLQLQPTPVSAHTRLVDVLVGWLGWLVEAIFVLECVGYILQGRLPDAPWVASVADPMMT